MLPRLVRVCPKTPKHKNWLSNTGLKLLWDYTNIVMNFLCGPQTSDSCSTLNFEWLRFFNVVTTGSAKQSLFHDENRANLFEVEPASRMLLNTDNGTPMPQVGGALRLPLKSLNKSCKVFQGGNVGHLHKLLGIESSSEVLYVGDHIYGDILRSKKVLGVAGWGVGGIEAEAIMLGQVQKKMQPLLLQNLLLLVIVTAMSEISWRDAKYGPRIKELSFLSFFIF
ncbi:cytosolic purine 5'-nucleotidase-like isoform X4 [Camellia sinensis]|uniref:cytosolic purine 5'-nucleotidase-like isoform X4 n=1 Tax=Camellia sinensis TaxID=4442 RepID=UPI001035F504|nr:cytosolic purine 5'-nucleotidase-like isoform X4 [Camellia sinensis]